MKQSFVAILLLCSLGAMSQNVVLNQQRHFPETVPAGNYSGITWMGGDRYAVVNDKSPTAGFYLMTIRTDSITGEILEARTDTFLTSGQPNRDEEGICYVPHTNTLFVSGEADRSPIEHTSSFPDCSWQWWFRGTYLQCCDPPLLDYFREHPQG